MPAELVLGTRNKKKVIELLDLLLPWGIAVQSLDAFPPLPEVIEDGATFADNAAKKAREQAVALNRWVLGEDSGLCVVKLGGAPGVYSARYSDPGATDERNNAKLLTELGDTPLADRGAYYVCSAALADPTGTIRATAEGYCHGRILFDYRGSQGFGYDPLFEVIEYHRTFAELGPHVKRALSHRGRVLREMLPKILGLLAKS